MESVIPELKKKTQKIDRVVLDSVSIAAIQTLQQQINNSLGDLVQISQKDIVNFILQERSFSLTYEELNKLKSRHFDLVKALKKATSEVIKAKQNGSEIQLEEVLKIIQTQSVSENLPLKKPRGRRKKVAVDGDAITFDELRNSKNTINKDAQNDSLKSYKADSKTPENQISNRSFTT